jgi:hypothetical protein
MTPIRWNSRKTSNRFINIEETVKPDSATLPGLFFYLGRSHGENGGDRRGAVVDSFGFLQFGMGKNDPFSIK